MSHTVCFLYKVERIHTNAVTTNQSGLERKKIPFCAGGLQYGFGVNIYKRENFGQFINKSNINIPLGILYNLGGLSHFYGRCQMCSCRYHCTIKAVHGLTGFGSGAGSYFYYILNGILAVARIDSFGRITAKEVSIELQSGYAFQNRY